MNALKIERIISRFSLIYENGADNSVYLIKNIAPTSPSIKAGLALPKLQIRMLCIKHRLLFMKFGLTNENCGQSSYCEIKL